MDVAIGFIGAIGGGLLCFAGAWWTVRKAQRSDRLVAARIVYSDLGTMRATARQLLTQGQWNVAYDWSSAQASWRETRTRLAALSSAPDWMTVDDAFNWADVVRVRVRWANSLDATDRNALEKMEQKAEVARQVLRPLQQTRDETSAVLQRIARDNPEALPPAVVALLHPTTETSEPEQP